MNGNRLFVAAALAAMAACSSSANKTETTTADGNTTQVKLCDDHTTVDIPSDMEKTRENGQAVADALMAQWKRSNPNTEWVADQERSHPNIPPPADNSEITNGGQYDDQTYGGYTKRDVLTWRRELELAVLDGARVFHDGDALGSTIAVSCDMCHPDAANTHPETYPKFQAQLGRVVLLRDMINWCLEHPVRAPRMAEDDPRMRAMEAYILAQRKGKVLNYGKH